MIKIIFSGMLAMFFSVASYAVIPQQNIYFDQFSVPQGEYLGVYSDYHDTPTFDLLITRVDNYNPFAETQVKTFKKITSIEQVTNDNAYKNGAGWKKNKSIYIDPTWPSGFYRARVIAPGVDYLYGVFVVQPRYQGSTSKILFLDNAPTNVAYNNWGGKSTYASNSCNPTCVAATSVSLRRPSQHYINYPEASFSIWAKNNNIPVEYASLLDLDGTGVSLSKYKMVVIAGHSEYWSKTMRDRFDAYIKNGGKAMILGGNTMYWQVRIENNKMVAYKETALTEDPVLFDWDSSNNATVTSLWSEPSPGANRPENKSIGVSWLNAGFVNDGSILPSLPDNNNGAFTAKQVNSPAGTWVYAGTSIADNTVFGKKAVIVGYEADGALYDETTMQVTGTDGTPANTTILAVADAQKYNGTPGKATMLLTEPFPNGKGGLIFNAATIGWSYGLYFPGAAEFGTPPDVYYQGGVDSNVSQITKNVIKRFSGY